MLSQHAITQSQTGETRHAIPTCYVETSHPSMQLANQKPGKPDILSQHAVTKISYPSMQSANQKPEKLDKLFQYVVEANHRSGKLDMLSQHTQCRHAIPSYTVRTNLYKKPRTVDKLTHHQAVQLEEPEQEEQQSKQLQHQLSWEPEDQ